MPIYEYHCTKCQLVFERLELSIQEIPTSQCPHCMGVGERIISRPSIVYTIFNERAVHKLPDWEQRKQAAQVHDAKVRRQFANQPPMPSDRGEGIKVYNSDFGYTERRKLADLARMEDLP
jgi:putative FmdB family regulatory protein